MSFYGGRPGQSFTITRVFKNFVEMYNEAQDSQSSLVNELYNNGRVPVGSFVLIAYGLGYQSTFAESMGEVEDQNSAYKSNRQEEINWFNQPDCPIKTVRAAADTNATLWWDIPWSASADYNGSVWVKCYDATTKTHYYAYVANIAGIFPEIANGQWLIGGVETGIRAEGRQIEFKAFYNEDLASYAFLTYTPEEVEEDSPATMSLSEDGETEEETPRPAQYGLANLADRFVYNTITGVYDWNEDGEFILVYEADKNGRYQYNENGEWKELGYFTLEDWNSVTYPTETNFTSDHLKWRYEDEEVWHDLFNITDLTSLKTYMLSALEASQSAESTKDEIEIIKTEIDASKEEIDENVEKTSEWISQAEGTAEKAQTAVSELEQIINNLPAGAELTDIDYLAGLIENAKGNFATLDQRLGSMPYQFNLIKDMRSCTSLERGDKAFTFGKDEVGDDDSKLFQIFDPENEEDKARLEETDEALISVYNPQGLKIDETYKIGTTGLVAGKLTVFSGKGSGGGSGGGTIPTLSSSLTSVTVQSGQTVTIDWYWTSANGGNGTIFIKDSMSNAAITDVADKSKNYTTGVATKRGASESFVWKPTDGVHKLTMYVVDGGGIPTNNVEIDITVGGIAYTATPTDGQNYSTDAVINLSYRFSTIYKTDKVVLHYDVYNDNVLRPDLSGEKESDFASGNQSITVTLKTRDTDIGVGVFKVVTYAFMKSDPSVATDQLTRNFIIAEANKIYLTTTFDSFSTDVYANKAFYIPLILTYSGGSSFTIEGKYSTTPGFGYEDGIELGVAEDVAAGKQIQFPARFADPGTYYLKFYAKGVGISATGESEEIIVEVGAENKQYILQRQADLLLNLSANEGQTNKNNRGSWENPVVVAGGKQEYFCSLTDFNYYANGWSTNADGIPEGWLLLNSKAYARIAVPILESTSKLPVNGFTLECVCKVNDIGLDAPVLDWTIGTPGKGMYIYKDRALINLPEAGVKALTVYFEPHGIAADSEAIHIAFVLDAVNRYAKIYLNGVLSGASELIYNELSGGKYATYNNIYLNRNNESDINKMVYGNCKVAAVRLYSDALTSDELVKNYIYNLQDEILQRTLWGRAGFVEKEGEEIQAAPTDGSVPYMKFFLKRADWERMTKDDKVPVTIEYYEKGSTTPEVWYNTKTSWQGTSSIAYPVKNFKIKLQKDLEGKKQKYKLDQDYGKKENTFCLKADYMDPSHIHNTGNANFIHNSGIFSKYTLTAAQASECGLSPDDKWVLPESKSPKSLATRTTIYGYPILLYICLESEDVEAGGTAHMSDEDIAKNDPISQQLKAELEAMSAGDAGYKEKKAEYDLAVAQYAVANRKYEPDKFWGIYNFNLDKGSNSSWGLYREDDYENYDMSDCTSFEVAANSAYSGGGFRCLKFVKKNGAEEYAWTRPYVYFNQDGNVNMSDNTYWSITRCNPDGSINSSKLKITDTHDNYAYTCYQNKTLDLTGFAQNGVRYSLNSETGRYEVNEYGDWMILYEMDQTSFKLKLDGDNNLIPLEGYYQITSEWKDIVEVSYSEVVPRAEWSIVEQLPENKDFYYDYYITDLELRFPDMDVYLFKSGDNEFYNKLLYKEYDKIIALVDYVDSYRDATQVASDGSTFLSTVSDHFDKDSLMNYYLFVMAVGLIDNFGKNMMMDTWGFDKNHQRPYRITEIDGVTYHQVYRYLGTWDEDEEYYTGIDDFEYGLLDISNVTEDEEGKKHFKIYPCDKNYTSPDLTADPIDVTATNGIANELIWDDVIDGDDQKMGWIHEIYEDKLVWCPHCYDLDSCLSSDNSGNLVFTPSIEMEDTYYILATDESKEVNAPPFNTSSSSLWSKVANGMRGDLAKRYIELQKDILTTDRFYETYYTNAIDTLGQRWYNGDAIPKYLSRDDITVIINNQVQTRKPIEFINLARGTDWQRTYKWLRHRLGYLGSMYDRDGTEGYAAGLEPRGANTGVTYSFDLELYEPMYMKIVGKNNQVTWVRSNKYNNKVVLTAPSSNDAADQEMYILPATNIKSFKEQHGYGYSTFKQNSANRLLEVDLSGSSALKAWNRSTDIKSENNLIQKINLNGCSALTGSTATIMGSDYPLLKEIDIRNSGAVFNFNNGDGIASEGGGILTTALLNDNISSLDIKNHFELEKVLIQLKYNENIQNESMVQSGHSTRIDSVNIENCPNLTLDLQYQIRSGNNYVSPTEVEWKYINNFINNVGPFALFQDINRFIIQNALSVEDVMGVRELKLSLSKINKVSINGCNINKIAFIANRYNLFGTETYASYPGTGGKPSESDSSYEALGEDGLICDENITEVEIRNIPGSIAEFRFPWRVHLGTLKKLQKLSFNVAAVNPKLYTQDSFGTDEDAKALGIEGLIPTAPKRFELILPDAAQNPDFNNLYINPLVSTINFTAIKQPGVDYTGVPAALRQNYVGGLWHFSGVDIRGYSSLVINFKGFKKITGILGMDTIDVSTAGSEVFKQYFADCQNLEELYGFKGGQNVLWNFSEWATGSNARTFTTLHRMFQNCYKLKNQFIQGWSHLNAINLTDASYMFENCQSITSAEDWRWTAPNLENIEGLFSNCYQTDSYGYTTGLTKANISILNNTYLTNISKVFKNCRALTHSISEPLPVAIYNPEGYLDTSKVTTMEELFLQCANIEGVSFKGETVDTDWRFDSVKSMKNMFSQCTSLVQVQLPDKADFSNTVDMSGMFYQCEKLKYVFQNSSGNEPILYNAEHGTKSPLTLENMFANCLELEDINCFAILDMTRVNNFARVFAYDSKLKGSTNAGGIENNVLDLSKWVTSENMLTDPTKPLVKNLSGLILGCAALQGIILPAIKNVTAIDELFKGCSNVETINVSPLDLKTMENNAIVPDVGISSLVSVFQDCEKLTSIIGYQNWNVSGVSKLTNLFAGCRSLTSLDLTKWRLGEKAKSLDSMFNNCASLEVIMGLREIVGTESTYSRNKVILTAVEGMFENCVKLNLGREELYTEDPKCDLRYWDYALSGVSSFKNMFNKCHQITSVFKVFSFGESSINSMRPYVGKYCKFEKLSSFEGMFANCVNLVHGSYFQSNFEIKKGVLISLANMMSGCSQLTSFIFQPKNGDFANLGPMGLKGVVDGCPALRSIVLIQDHSLKRSVYLETLGLSENSPFRTQQSNWADVFARLEGTCFDFGGDNNPVVPNIDYLEGFIHLPHSSVVPVAHEAFKASGLADMGWSVYGTI